MIWQPVILVRNSNAKRRFTRSSERKPWEALRKQESGNDNNGARVPLFPKARDWSVGNTRQQSGNWLIRGQDDYARLMPLTVELQLAQEAA